MRNVVFVASLFFMGALVPRSECAPSPSIYCTVNEIKAAGSTALFLTLGFLTYSLLIMLSLCGFVNI